MNQLPKIGLLKIGFILYGNVAHKTGLGFRTVRRLDKTLNISSISHESRGVIKG